MAKSKCTNLYQSLVHFVKSHVIILNNNNATIGSGSNVLRTANYTSNTFFFQYNDIYSIFHKTDGRFCSQGGATLPMFPGRKYSSFDIAGKVLIDKI